MLEFMSRRSIFLALGLFSVSLTLHAQRLPGNAHPEHYRLALTPSIADAKFAGSEVIDLKLDTPSKTITLNAIELEIASVKAGSQTGAISFDKEKGQATFTFAQALPAGQNSLAIEFSGILNDKLRGFYLSKTKAGNYAVTQFESTDARRAFPCFDEPALKATFDVTLTVDAGDMAISNTNIVSDTPVSGDIGKHTVVFATTPKMSTYLVAFLVGEFACSQGKADGVPIRVCSTPDKVRLTKFAVSAAEHFLHYYDDYFGIKYPMPKLDLIGIPDFEAGAMENFGAITYRETALLVDEKEDSTNAMKSVASVIAHEMAHQWFGDMVTMQWWDNLWLNEGFATWMADKAAGQWHPEWNFSQDAALSLDGTMNYDAGKITHPIRANDVTTPAQIEELFDGISYGKGGAVLGMVEHYLGEETFRQGVHRYLAAHLYANATAEDFWNAQTANSHKPVDKIMASFVTQPGVPLLTIGEFQRSGDPVAQSRFYLAGTTGDSASAKWTIPVCLKTSAAPVCEVLTPESNVLPLPVGLKMKFLYANADAKGYFRTIYTPGQLQAIIAGAETELSPVERIGLVGDRWALTRAGQGSVGDYLDLALALKADPNSSLLDSTLGSINSIKNRVADDTERQQLDTVIRVQYGPVYAALGAPSKKDSYDRQEIRSTLFAFLGAAKDPAVVARARQIADDIFSGNMKKDSDDLDLSDVAISITAADAGADVYDRVLIVSQKATDPGSQTDALRMLTRFHQPELVERTLDYATSGAVRNQDSWVLIAAELQQPQSREQAWEYVQQHWDRVKAQLTVASGNRIVSATGNFCTVKQRDEVKSFFATHPVEASERALAQSLDNIASCIDFRAKQQPNLARWLAQHTP